LTGPLTKRWGEALIIKASLLGSVLGFLVMLLANSFATVLLTVGLFVFGNAMLRPVLASLISKRATTGQGVAMGLNNSFMSLGRMVGPIWAGFIFDLNFNLPYVSGSIAMLIGFFASMLWLEEERPQPPEVEPQFTPR
jgi:DHA1 family multidrug resistance protein-like MFS transporter